LRVDPSGKVWWVAAGAVVGGVANLAITYKSNSGDITFEQGLAAFAGGAVSGAIGALGGPLGGTVAKTLFGLKSTGTVAISTAGIFSGLGGYTGQVLANCIDPEHQSDAVMAFYAGTVGGAIGKAMPTAILNTVKQADTFAKNYYKWMFRNSENAKWFWASLFTSTAVGATPSLL